MLNDLRFALRTLLRRKMLFAIAVITLALGVGASTSLFSIVNGVLLQPLPYRDSDRLAVLWHVFGQGAQDLPAMHQKDFADYRDRARTLEELTIATGNEAILGDATDPQIVRVGLVQANFFNFLGVPPQLGRTFRAEEDVTGGPRVLMLSDRLWRSRFGGDPGIIGRNVLLNGNSAEVVGVLPAGFKLELPAETYALRDSDVYRPSQINFNADSPRNFTAYTVFARLAPAVTFAQAQDELSRIAGQLREEHAVHAASDLRMKVIPFHHDVVKGASRGLWMLLGAVVLVLAIACANVALLMLARGSGRDGELIVRVAVGASRWRIARLVLIESLVLAGFGGVLGVLLAQMSLSLLNARALAAVPRLQASSIDLAVLAFAVAATTLSGIAFGLIPALRASRVDLAGALRSAAVGSAPRHTGALREFIVAAQIALGLVLVVGTGLMVRSFQALASSHPGFEPRGVLTMRVSVPPAEIRNAAAVNAYHVTLAQRLKQLPGVSGAGVVSQLPLAGQGPLQPYAYDAETARNWESLSAEGLSANPGYFAAAGVKFLSGRDFTYDDVQGERRVVVIDESLAARAYGGAEKAIGQRLQLEPENAAESFFEVIGVVNHVRYNDLRRELLPQIYRAGSWVRFSLAVRTDGDPAALAEPVRRALGEVVAGTAVQDVRPFATVVDEALGPTRLAVWLMSGFGLMALLLAAVGIYGAFSYFVGERTREIAVRMALGATPGSIRGLVMARGLRVLAIGLGVGVVAAVALTRAAASLFYGVRALDAVTYAGAVACLACVAMAACWLPARRASRTDPQSGLRA